MNSILFWKYAFDACLFYYKILVKDESYIHYAL